MFAAIKVGAVPDEQQDRAGLCFETHTAAGGDFECAWNARAMLASNGEQELAMVSFPVPVPEYIDAIHLLLRHTAETPLPCSQVSVAQKVIGAICCLLSLQFSVTCAISLQNTEAIIAASRSAYALPVLSTMKSCMPMTRPYRRWQKALRELSNSLHMVLLGRRTYHAKNVP